MNILFKSIFTFSFFTFHFLFAVSAPPSPFEVEQPDGSKIPVRMFGHEYYNWMETEDGYVMDWVEDDNRLGWYYCDLNSEGKFSPTHILVRYPSPNYLDIPKNLREISPKVRTIRHSNLQKRKMNNSVLNRSISPSVMKPLVFLVDFNNLSKKEHSVEDFSLLLFDEDLNPGEIELANDYSMSVREYYDEVSNGNLDISGDSKSIVDWTTVEHDYSYYVDGVQGTGQGNGLNETNTPAQSAAAIVVEIAMTIQDSLDFSKFDGDGDGAVDVVILIIEGTGGTGDNHFWPHMSYIQPTSSKECIGICEINSEAPLIDNYFAPGGVVINKYIVIMEQYNEILDPNQEILSGMIHPIGTICHELGHVLGLPDLYDTSDNSAAGIGIWGLMGSGNWNSQKIPAYMSAWSRYSLGFINPIVVDNVTDTEAIILPAEKGGEEVTSMILSMDSNMPQEYLLLENRQKLFSDINLKEAGLFVWHIDETITGMYPAINSVNVNPDYYGVNLLQADGLAELNYCTDSNCSDDGDPFPGSSDVDYLPNHNIPSINTYSYDRDADGYTDNGKNSNIELSDIFDHGDHISMKITNPNEMGSIISYDEGDYTGHGISDQYDFLQWAGILFSVPTTRVLSSVQTVFPPSFWLNWDVTDYTIKIWEGWSNNNKPETLLNTFIGGVHLGSVNGLKDGGWVNIPYLKEHILLEENKKYYIEIKYDGIGGIYPFDKADYSNSIASKMSFYRGNNDQICTEFENGDWNIRAVLSGQNCGEISDKEIWPGDMNGDLIVDANDIIPLGIYFESQGCYRLGDAYLWEAQPYPDGWDMEEAARADANGDGFVNIADLLVILVNWNKDVGFVSLGNDEKSTNLISQNLEDYRSTFHQLYKSMSGDTEPEVLMREKLEEIFEFEPIPAKYILRQNYPNPFNARTTIPYYIADKEEMTIIVYDMRGRIVENFSQINNQEGWHEIVFNANNMSSGIYFYRLVNEGNIVSQKKMLLMK